MQNKTLIFVNSYCCNFLSRFKWNLSGQIYITIFILLILSFARTKNKKSFLEWYTKKDQKRWVFMPEVMVDLILNKRFYSIKYWIFHRTSFALINICYEFFFFFFFFTMKVESDLLKAKETQMKGIWPKTVELHANNYSDWRKYLAIKDYKKVKIVFRKNFSSKFLLLLL